IIMSVGLIYILQILGALGLFVFGMKTASEALQRIMGNRLGKVLQSHRYHSRIFSILKGTFINGFLQSSTTASVMTISFSNSGLLSLQQATGVLMGIFISSSVTAWIIALVAHTFSLTIFAIVLIGCFFPLLFIK